MAEKGRKYQGQDRSLTLQKLLGEADELQFAAPIQGAEFTECFGPLSDGQTAQAPQKYERATLGGAVPGAQAGIGEATMAVVE